jgi:hypothetical protein
MVNDIITAVETQLKTLCPNIYKFYQPQHFKTPSFLISVTDHGYGRLLHGTYASKISLDVQYFSGAKSVDIKAIRTDCVSMQETLLRGFNLVGGFRCINKDARITDNVLHFTFDVKYSERTVISDSLMASMTSDTNIKE